MFLIILIYQEDIAKLLRFESSGLPAGQQTSLMDYASRMKAGTRNIYYLCVPNRHLAEHSPYYEAMKMKDMEVSSKSSRSEDRSRLNKIMVGISLHLYKLTSHIHCSN